MRRALLALALIAVVSCGDEDDKGFPPNITNLQLLPPSSGGAGTIAIAGTIDFTDREGDVESYTATVSGPGGTSTVGPTAANVSGQTQGTLDITLVVAAPGPGTYAVQIYLEDAPGNRSNTLGDEVELE